MASLTAIEDHATQAQARLLEQLKGRPNMTALLGGLTAAVQLCEDQIFSLYTGRNLFGGGAQGEQLDNIAALVGTTRSGQNDAGLTATIDGQIAANTSQADHATLLRIAELLFEASDAAVLDAFSPGHSAGRAPASLRVQLGSPQIDPSLMARAQATFARAVAAGVSVDGFSEFTTGDAFTLAGANSGKGLGDNSVSGSGGALASNL